LIKLGYVSNFLYGCIVFNRVPFHWAVLWYYRAPIVFLVTVPLLSSFVGLVNLTFSIGLVVTSSWLGMYIYVDSSTSICIAVI
jgi:hypothetical protein